MPPAAAADTQGSTIDAGIIAPSARAAARFGRGEHVDRGQAVKVLINAVGKRRQFVQTYQAGAASRRIVAVAGDADPLAPAMTGPGAVRTPRLSEPDYEARWQALITAHGLTHLLSLIDTDQDALARVAERAGITYLGPAAEARALAHDKYAFFTALRDAGLPVVHTALAPLTDGTFISKDRCGSCGSNVVCHEPGSTPAATSGRIFQPRLEGPHVDVDFFFDGETLVVSQKEILAKEKGESFRFHFVWHDAVEALMRDLVEAIGYRGVGNADVWWHDGRWELMEVNPRFGGNYPASHIAGIDLIACQLAGIRGEPLPALAPREATGRAFVKSWAIEEAADA